jgi:sugar-specific transcriptional regulator TrmB
MDILSEIGFSQREIAVYRALLKLGSTTTGPLVKESGVQNAKIYETLEKLIKRGSATFIMKGEVKYFQATNPNNLLGFFDNKRETLQKKVNELQTLQEKKEPEYQTRVYEGIKAIKSAFFELYDYIGESSEYYAFPIGEQLKTEELILFWSQVFQKRLKMKIKLKTLPNIKWKSIFQEYYKKELRLAEVRYTSQEFPTGIFIFKDNILNVLWNEKPAAFLIKSKENAERWKLFFDEQWKIANP